jgi:hypothetical protein
LKKPFGSPSLLTKTLESASEEARADESPARHSVREGNMVKGVCGGRVYVGWYVKPAELPRLSMACPRALVYILYKPF